jgi:hypothetical protein
VYHRAVSCYRLVEPRNTVGAELLVENDVATGVRTVTLGKQRDGSTEFSASFKLQIVDVGREQDGTAVTSCVVEPATPPPRDADTSDLQVYRWIWAWNSSENGGASVSREKIRRNFGRIKPKNYKMRRDDFLTALEGAVNAGWCTENDAPRGGKTLTLKPPRDEKY